MSKDFRLKNTCNHHVVREWISIDNDFQSIRTIKNPASKEINVRRNGRWVPQSGNRSNVEITSLNKGPFEIEPNDNEIFKLSVNDGKTQSITLPTGQNVTTQIIVEKLNNEIEGVEVENKNGRVNIKGKNTPQGFPTLMLKGGSSHSTLGFPSKRFYRSRIITPSWRVVSDDLSEDPQAKKIRFSEPLNATDDVFEVSYYTTRENCRRCQGTGIEYDFRHNKSGDFKYVEGSSLLLQEIEKIIFTIKGSNLFHTWYGTSINDMIGSKITGGEIVETQLVSEISSALDNYLDVKNEQAKYQPVTRSEKLRRVVSLSVEQNNQDPTTFEVALVLESEEGDVERFQENIKAPKTARRF